MVHKSVWRTPFVAEMREWQPISGARDDGLDAVAGCLLAEPVRIQGYGSGVSASSMGPSWRAAVVHAAKTEFSV